MLSTFAANCSYTSSKVIESKSKYKVTISYSRLVSFKKSIINNKEFR